MFPIVAPYCPDETPDKLLRLDTSHLEIYSALLLGSRKHWRAPTLGVSNPVTCPLLHIPVSAVQYLDDDLSVVRPGSDIFNRCQRTPLKADFQALAFLCCICGKTDNEEKRRKSDSDFCLLEFGIKPELQQVYGNHNFEKGKKVDSEKTERARISIGVGSWE